MNSHSNFIIPLFKPSEFEVTVAYRIFCFHWCGGNAQSFSGWAKHIENSLPNLRIEIYSVSWKVKNKTYTDIKEICQGISN